MQHTKHWVCEEVVAPVITVGLAVQWGIMWSESPEEGILIFVWENQRSFISKVTFCLGLEGRREVFQERVGRIEETLGKGTDHGQWHIISWKDLVGPGEGERFRVSGVHGIKGQGWKVWSHQIVEVFVDHAEEFGFHPSH